MLLLDLSHTSHTRARTGIQRVCRSLRLGLRAQGKVTDICHDPYRRDWRVLQNWEEANLSSGQPAGARGARWPLRARWGGRLARWLQQRPAALPAADGLIVPEVFSPATARALPALISGVRGPCVAVFHDAIALKHPEMSPAKTVARFPAYLQELTMFDGIAAVSEDSRDSLLDYWRWAGLANPPPVTAITLGLDPVPAVTTDAATASGDPPTVLVVGTIEGRKNHSALLEACEQLWSRGLQFQIHLIGLAHPHTGRAALQKLRDLQNTGRPLRYDGPVDEAGLHRAYRSCHFTVYPSLIEGFGLPVLESMMHGKPCICSAHGALGESTRGGGCLALPAVDTGSLAEAMARLLTEPTELAALAAAARARTCKDWSAYARELTEWMGTLKPRR